MRKSVVLLGKGTPAIRVAEWFLGSDDHELRCVVPVVPEPGWSDSLIDWCRERGVKFVPSGDFADIEGVDSEGWRVDLAFCAFYSHIIRPWFIRKADRFLNLHNAPLPRYRGVAPINWALKNGERIHGVTIHELVPRVDAGPVVGQVLFPIDPEEDEVIDVYDRSIEFGYTLFTQTMPNLDCIKPRPQDESKATCYSRKDQGRLGERRFFTRAESQSAQAVVQKPQ